MHDISYLRDILVLLFASVGIIIIFKQLGLSPVLGYLVAGALIGPQGFALLNNTKTAQSIAELGIVFLLFAIGLELTFDRIKAMKKYVLGFGSLQVLLTAAAIGYIAYILGVKSEVSVIIGSTLALSSTAIVLQVVNESGDQSTRVGRLSLSVLLLQDLAVIPILVLLPLLSNPEISIGAALSTSLTNAAFALAIIFVIGRLFLRPIFRLVVEAKSDVLFLSTTLIVVLGAAFISNELGLSFALGAFVAGLMVAETEYKYRVESEILSLKSLLMGLFFMTIGTSFEFDLLIEELPLIALLSLGLIACKGSIVIILCRIFKFPLAPAIHSGLLLSQGGEFAFVVFIMSVENNMMSAELSQLLMTVVTVTMAVTPLLASLGKRIKSQIYLREALHDNKIKREVGDISDHVIVLGFGKIGRIVTHILRNKEINYLVLDNNHRVVRIEKANGYNIYYGDSMNIDILRNIGIHRAKSVIVAIEDEFACIKITRFINANFPEVQIITKTDTLHNAERFKKFGASFVVTKNLETGLQLGKAALISTGGIEGEDIDNFITKFRDINADFIENVLFKNSGKVE
ncbi:MAG: cation:proton antiporter [Proteobacteria bacterium]|nr:cation:proton antiporter [Pseudomonadota bacterium]